MTTYLLIHGAWQGAWIWKDIVERLEQAGHRAVTMDLPGSGADQTPAGEVTLDRYAEAIIAKAREICSDELVLVGHSMGGAAITQAASAAPDLFDQLIYVCAFLPRTGESVAELAAKSHEINHGGPAPKLTEDKTAAWLEPDNIAASLLNGCPEDVVTWATPQFKAQPLAPLQNPVTRSEGFAALPKRYICCLEDQAIAAPLQREMAASAEITDLREMHSGHEPFFSAPQELAKHLL